MKRSNRWRMTLATLSTLVVLGLVIDGLLSQRGSVADDAEVGVPGVRSHGYPGEVHERFQQAAVMLHAGQAEYALVALQRVLELAPDLPEAHVNLGFALIDLARIDAAHRHFERALALRPMQANAYYGLAMTHEHRGDLESALGAMRTYIHLAEESAYTRRARAAIWEWTSRLERTTVGSSTPAAAGATASREARG